MTIDAEGMLWVAMYDGWKVSQLVFYLPVLILIVNLININILSF